jgi:uncharacterized protein YerC
MADSEWLSESRRQVSDNVGVLVYTCTKSQARKIQALRRKGYPYKTIAAELGKSTTTVARFDRLLEKYSIDVFADDR